MRTSLLALTVAVLVAAVCGAPAARTPFDDFANIYIDKVMEGLRPHLKENNMDPLPMDNVVIGFSKQVLLITVHGSIGLTDGRLHGLSTIHRAGDCQIHTEGTKLIVAAKVGVNNLWGAFNGHAQFMGLGVNVKLSLAVDSTTVGAGLTMDMGGSGATPELTRFSIDSISKITIRFSGLGLLDWIINPVTNVLVNVVRGILIKVIEIPVREQVKKVLKNIKLLPFEE